MDDTSRTEALDICGILVDLRGLNVLALHVGPHCSWTDYLVIATAGSRVHMNGLAGAAGDKMRELGLPVSGGSKKAEEDSWRMLDGGNVVVSLMNLEARNFYALEELWYESDVIYRSENQSSISS